MANLTYRISGPTAPVSTTVKLTGLTNAEVDGNFKSLDDAKYEKTGGTISGDVVINGNLSVNGSSTTINTNTVSVDDKNIELGSVVAITGLVGTISTSTTTSTITGLSSTSGLIVGMALTKTAGTGVFGTSPLIVSVDSATQITITSSTANTLGSLTFNAGGATELTANGGGLTLKGASDKTIIWDNTNANWTSSENWNIASAKTYKINNVSVLSSTTLGSTVLASSLTSVGSLTALTVSGNVTTGTGYIQGATNEMRIFAGTGNTLTLGTNNAAGVLTISTTGTATFTNTVTGTSFNSITGLSSTTPAATGVAAVGTGTTVARADHVHAAPTTITGNAGTATTLANARLINGVSFNGSADITVTADAGTLSGATLNATVTGSSLTTVGVQSANLVLANGVYVSGKNTTGTTTRLIGINGTTNVVYLGDIDNVSAGTTIVRAAGLDILSLTATGITVTGTVTGTSFNSITGLSSTTPAATGVAAVGVGTTAARADHVHVAPTTITGNAGTATTLATARLINGVSFNGSADITVTAAAGTLSGATLNATVTGSSLTSVGTLASLAVTGAITGASFNSITGLSSTTPAATGVAAVGVGTTAARADHVHVAPTTVTGNAGTATTLATARLINGVSFNGSADITITAAAGTLSGTTLNATVTGSSLTSVGTLTALSTSGATLLNGAVQIAGSSSAVGILYTGAGSQFGLTFKPTVDTTTGTAINFFNAAGTAVGSITQSSTTITYNGSGAGLTASSIPVSSLVSSSVTVNGTAVTLGGSATVTAAAGTLTGATLNATVTGSSLTSVGTLASLAVTGAITGTSFNSITGLSAVAGAALGTAAVGTATTAARADHVHAPPTNITGNAATVTTNANLTGDVTSVGNATTLATVNANVGVFGSATAIPIVTVNGKGLITAISTSAITVGDGALTVSSSAGATNTSVALALSGAYSANTSTARSLNFTVGPAITNLSTLMTTAGAGFIKRGAVADTYTVDTSTYLTSSNVLFVGTTSISLGRTTAAQALTGITSIDGYAADVGGGVANQILYQTAANATSYIAAPTTANTALTWSGSAFAWGAAGAAITDDTTTDATRYLLWDDITTGNATSVGVSSTKLYFNPNTGTLNSTNFNSLSDARLKENVVTLSSATDTVKSLNGVSFDWKENGKRSYGVIAQELEAILPELVEGTDVKTVNYAGIIAFLINSVKEMDARIVALEKNANK